MNSGSVDSWNVSVRCGCRAKARQIRETAVWLKPEAWAIPRGLQGVACGGFDSRVWVTTRSASASLIVRGAPGRGSSSKPSRRRSTNRARRCNVNDAIRVRQHHDASLSRLIKRWKAVATARASTVGDDFVPVSVRGRVPRQPEVVGLHHEWREI